MEFITTYNLWGLTTGISTFLIIGLFHPIVIKAEYYFGTGCWWAFLVAGLALTGVSRFSNKLDVWKKAGSLPIRNGKRRSNPLFAKD